MYVVPTGVRPADPGAPGVSSSLAFDFASACRALTLWAYDHSLVLALDVAKALSRPVEYLMTLWPCPGERAFHPPRVRDRVLT